VSPRTGPSLWQRALALIASEEDEPQSPPEPTCPGPIGRAEARRRLWVRGQIGATAVTRHPHSTWFEADLVDSSGQIRLIWLGRREVSGVTPGRTLEVRGRVGRRGDDLVVFNPDYLIEADGAADQAAGAAGSAGSSGSVSVSG
jgi:hypothetical protein